MMKIYNNAYNDLSLLNDEFDDARSLAQWEMHHKAENWPSFTEDLSIIEARKNLKIVPQSSGWYGEYHRGPFLFKEIEGNFTVITKVKATGKTSESPRRSYSLAGLMVRNARPSNKTNNEKGHENWMFLSTGSATKKGKPQLETKNTINGKSKLKIFPIGQGWVNIAISRIGNTFYQSYRLATETNWTLLRVIHRPDIGKKVQVGLLAYTDFWNVAFKTKFNYKKFNTTPIKGKPDLIGYFEYVHFFRIDKDMKNFDYPYGYNSIKIPDSQIRVLKLE
nr:DUF1349 domain-containing protein [uncultured Draconibacterium sp.]